MKRDTKFQHLAQLVMSLSLCCQVANVSANEPKNEPKPSDLTELSLEELVQIEIPSVVGASKYEQKANIAPSSVTVISADEIRKYGYLKLSDILRSARGFYTGNDHNYEFLGVRGFSLPGDYNSRVLVLIDGHRINDPVYQQGMIGGEFPLDVDLIDRVEIIRGPGSSLYGTSAFFGVVNVIPKRGGDLNGVELSGGIGNFSTTFGRISGGKKLDNGVDFVISASAYDRDGQDRLTFSELAGDITRNNGIYDKHDGEQWKSVYSSLKYKDVTLEFVSGQRAKDFASGLYSTAINAPGSFSVDRHEHIDLQIDHVVDDKATLFARLYHDRYDFWGDYVADGAPVNRDDLDSKWWGGELRYTRKFGGKHKLTLGAEYVNYYEVHQLNRDIDPVFGCVDGAASTIALCLDSDKSQQTTGVFVQDEFSINDQWTLNWGLRHDKVESNSSTNPRLGLIFAPNTDTTLKLLYGTAFRAPNGYELYYDARDLQTNPDLGPEKIKTLEFAWEQRIGKNLRATASAYEYRITDLIAQNDEVGLDGVAGTDDDVLVYRNLNKVKARGLDLELQAKWARLEGRVSYSYQRAEDQDSGESLPNVPRNMAKLNLIAPVLRDKLYAGLEVQYLSNRLNVQNSTQTRVRTVPAYTVANLTLTQRNWIKGLELSAGVYNMFDKHYRDPNSSDDDDAILRGNPQEGRSYRFRLTYKF